jgi:type I site-specific restriction-modification system R (restriction) subunit
MYLLRGPHAQTLLQTISRVNRPYKSPTGKVYKYGYICDFVDIEKEYDNTIEAYIKELEADLNDNGEDENSLAGLVIDKEDINRKYLKYKKELEDNFRTITQLGYALVFISHDKDKTFKRKDGTEYNQTIPTAQTSLNNIAKDMADIYAYASLDDVTGKRSLTMRSLDNTVECGSRFKYMPAEIPLDYNELVKALNEAIDKEAKENDNKYVTNERIATPEVIEYNYDALMEEFQTIVAPLMQKDSNYYGPRIVSIVEKYLGKGKKVPDTTIDQVEFIYLIVSEMKEELK